MWLSLSFRNPAQKPETSTEAALEQQRRQDAERLAQMENKEMVAASKEEMEAASKNEDNRGSSCGRGHGCSGSHWCGIY